MINRVLNSPSRRQQECLLLTSACLLMALAGQTLAGPVYANFMRSAFEMKQSELDVAMMLQYGGAVLMFVSGIVYDRLGPRVTVMVGGITSTLASIAITLAFAFPAPLRGHPWVLWVLMFVYGHAFNYGEVAATAVGMVGFRVDRRGLVMAALVNCFNLGAPLPALLHYVIFGNMNKPPYRQNAVGPMAVQTVLTAAVHTFALIFIQQPVLHGGSDGIELGERTPIVQAAGDATAASESQEENKSKVMPNEREQNESAAEFMRATCTACCTGPYVLLLAGFALSQAQFLAVWNNVTTTTRCLRLSGKDVIFFWIPTILAIVWRSVLGPISDRFFVQAFKRAAIMLACMIIFGSPALLLITVPMYTGVSPLGVILSSYTLSALLSASAFNLGPVILSQTSPPPLFGRLFSLCTLVSTALSLPLTLQSGLIYDRRATVINGTASCNGEGCYIYGNIANSSCHFVSVICILGLTLLLRVRGSS